MDGVGELLIRAGHGDQAAWNAIVVRYSGLLCAIARSYGLGGADRDDVVQTTWLRLVERLPLRDPERVGAWLAVTARRESLQTLRRLSRERPLPAEGPSVTGPHHAVIRRDQAKAVAAAVAALPQRCRGLLELLAMTPPLSYAEISAALGVPIGTIGPTRARCLKRLGRQLQEGTS